MTIFAPLQAQPTLGFGGTGYVSWSGRTSSDAPYIPGTDTDAYDTWSLFCGDICIPDDAGVISVPLGAIYPRFAPGLGGYSTFPLHPMLSNGIDLASGVNTPLYDYDVTCDYEILPYADPDPSGVSAISGTDFDTSSGTLTFQYPKCGYQDGYVDGPFEAGTRIATLSINVHGIGKFYPQFGPTANKNRFKVRFTNPIAMNLPGFTNDAIATSYELTFRILGTTAPPVYWQDYGTVDCGHVRGHTGIALNYDNLLPGQAVRTNWIGTIVGQMGVAGASSAYNYVPAQFALPFTAVTQVTEGETLYTVPLIPMMPNGNSIYGYRAGLVHKDLITEDDGSRYLTTEFESDINGSGVYTWVPGNGFMPQYETSVTFPSCYLEKPTVTINGNYGAGSGATAEVDEMLVCYSFNSDFIDSPGSGYSVGDVVTLDDGTAFETCEITITEVGTSGVVVDAQITESGSYDPDDLPTGSAVGGGGSGVAFNINYGVKHLNVTSLGSGYTYGATISFSGLQETNPGHPSWETEGPATAIFYGKTAKVSGAKYSATLNRYSSSVYSEFRSDKTNDPGYVDSFSGFYELVGSQLYSISQNLIGRPIPQTSEYTIDVSPSGLLVKLPTHGGFTGFPSENTITSDIIGRKSSPYTVSEFLDDFAILSGLLIPVFGEHKAVCFDAEGIGMIPQMLGYTPSSTRNDDGRIEASILSTVNVTNGGSGYVSAPIVSGVITDTYYTPDSFTIVNSGVNYLADDQIIVADSVLNVDSVDPQYYEATDIVITTPGSGFSVGNRFNDAGGGLDISVTSVDGSGGITGLYINYAGSTLTPPSNPIDLGSGATITVTWAINPDSAGPISAVSIVTPANVFDVPANPINSSYGSGSGATFNGSFTQVDDDTYTNTGLIAVLNEVGVASITLDTPGDWFTVAPTIRIEGGGGSGATAHCDLVPTSVASVTLTHRGTGYTSIPSVVVDGNATAVAVLTATAVDDVTINDAGRGYTAIPTVSFSPSGATATAYLKMVPQLAPNPAVIIASAGSGYTVGDLLYIGSGSPDLVTPAVIRVDTVDGSGGIMTASIHTAGVWSIDPGANPITSNGGGTGSGASFNVKWGVSHVVGPNYGDYTDIVGEFGGSYQDIPTVSFVGACDSAATATAVLKCTSLQSITLTDGGSGYTSRPTVTISGGGGVQAQAVAVLTGTPIDSITLDSSGSGYSSAPTVYFDYYGIVTEPTATAVLQGRSVDHIDITYPQGATEELVLTGGGGAGATAEGIFETANISVSNVETTESGVAIWSWSAPPSGVSTFTTDINFTRESYANPDEGHGTPSELNETVGNSTLAYSFFGIVGWYYGMPQNEIDQRITYRSQRRGIIGSTGTYIGHEYPVKVFATIITWAWHHPTTHVFTTALVNELSRVTVDITETDSYIVEPPGAGPYGTGGFKTVTFEYVVQAQATAPGPTSYP